DPPDALAEGGRSSPEPGQLVAGAVAVVAPQAGHHPADQRVARVEAAVVDPVHLDRVRRQVLDEPEEALEDPDAGGPRPRRARGGNEVLRLLDERIGDEERPDRPLAHARTRSRAPRATRSSRSRNSSEPRR